MAPRYYAVSWKLYYGDGTTQSGPATQDWSLVPTTNVQGFWIAFSDGTSRVGSGNDCYFNALDTSGQPIYANTNMTPAQILAQYPSAIILQGQWISDAMVTQIEQQMMADANTYYLSVKGNG